jgi:ketosteroid isomerase-like protein
MSQENVEIVRAVYDAWQRGDYEGVFKSFDEDLEWIGPPDVSGAGERRGHDGVRRSMRDWMGTWDDYRFELCELVGCRDQVLAGGWQHGRGRGSGVEVSEEIFSVWTLQGGTIVRQRMFRDRSQAVEAAGLRQ